MVTFAGLLRQWRMEAGLSQEELAEAAGVGARTVSDLERGVALTARKDTARLLADALNLAGKRGHRMRLWPGDVLLPGYPRHRLEGRAGRLRPGRCLVISHRSRVGSRSCGSWSK